MTKPEKMLLKFKKILRLNDWDITLEVLSDDLYQQVHGKDFKYDTNGCTEISHDKTAKIYLKASLNADVMFTTLLHECVHLVTHPYDQFVRETLKYVDSKTMAKKLKNDALWEMEILVATITSILKPLIK